MQSIEEREEERVSSWESYISPTTSVGINPGQFILLNLFRLAQIVTVSRPNKTASKGSRPAKLSSSNVYSVWGMERRGGEKGRELSPTEDR